MMKFGEGKRRISLIREQELTRAEQEKIAIHVKGLPVPGKLEYAIRGNREVRAVLSRDPNKIVARAVITSPRLSDEEVLGFARSTNVNEEVLRGIAENPKMVKNKRIVVALCNNPRTPVGISIKFLSRLDLRELRLIAKNRDIASPVRMHARRIVTLKKR